MKIFVDSELMGQSAYFGWQDKDEALYGLREGYKNSADDLVEIAVNSGNNVKVLDTYIFPILFSYRHCLEISLKHIYMRACGKIPVGGHNLLTLWDIIFVKKIFTELEMRYNGNLINNYRPPKSKGEKVGHSWWITTFNAGMQNNVNPSKIGFRCVADLSVLKAYARKALERRLEKSKRWNVEGNKATLKWNY